MKTAEFIKIVEEEIEILKKLQGAIMKDPSISRLLRDQLNVLRQNITGRIK